MIKCDMKWRGKMEEELKEAFAEGEKVVQLLQDSQQMAMDLGNMLEVFCGENCSVIGLLEQYCEAIYALYYCNKK